MKKLQGCIRAAVIRSVLHFVVSEAEVVFPALVWSLPFSAKRGFGGK